MRRPYDGTTEKFTSHTVLPESQTWQPRAGLSLNTFQNFYFGSALARPYFPFVEAETAPADIVNARRILR